jgi:hypothetical protein
VTIDRAIVSLYRHKRQGRNPADFCHRWDFFSTHFQDMPKVLALILKFGIAVLMCGVFSIAMNLPANAAPPPPIDALILVRANTIAEMDQAVDFIRARGGRVLVTIAPNALFVDLPTTGTAGWVGQRGIEIIATTQVDAEATTIQYGEQAGLAARAWNQMLATLREPDTSAPPGMTPLNDALIPSDRPPRAPAVPSAPPTSSQTSEFLYGSVQVDVFLPESNGGTENWTTTMRDNVVAEVTAGVTWWASAATQGGRPSANLSFNLTFHTPFNEPSIVATNYEPIANNHPTSSSLLWIGDILSHLGYSASISGARAYVNAQRVAAGRDWAFAIFVANSLNDSDGLFADGYFAYAYLNGPYMVLTYDNDGWGISRMEMVTAHEMGHIFGALDEYAESGCTTTETSGYLNVANTNCENGTPTEHSIMRGSSSQLIAYPNYQASTPVRGMIGWRDSDSDGLYDVVDTSVQLSASRTSGGTAGQPATYSGTATDIPWDSPTHTDTSLNEIVLVQFRVDGGAWSNATAGDGAFDEYSESFSVTTAALGGGTHTIEIQACNSVGNCSSWTDTINVSGGSSCYTLTANINPSNGGSANANPLPNCGAQYNSGTSVAVTPSPNTDYVFQSWSGCDSVVGMTCNVTMNANKIVTANFVPMNDDFNNAFVIGSNSYTRSQRVDGATTAADDPSFTCISGQRVNSVWYRFVAPSDGTLTTNTFSSSYDTVLAIWTGTRGALTSRGCNDDYVSGSNFQSQVQIAATGGTTYYIEVAAYSAPASPATLNFALSFAAAGGGTTYYQYIPFIKK